MTDDAATNPFADLAEFMALPRLSGLALSPDGNRLVTAVAALNPDRTRWQTALWEIDPAGLRPARRLTRSAPGESGGRFLPDGDLIFTSTRPDAGAKPGGDDKPPAALWLLPAAGGEARLLTSPPGGVNAVAVASASGDVAIVSPLFPGATAGNEDKERRTARKDAGVTAILHEAYPVRYWDHDLGPAWPHVLFAGAIPPEGADVALRDLTPDAGLSAGETSGEIDLSPDGRMLVRSVDIAAPGASRRIRLEVVDTATGAARVLAESDDASWYGARFSPDGERVVCTFETQGSYDEASDQTTFLIDVATGEQRPVAAGFDRWFVEYAWSPDGTAIFAVADDDGAAPVFRIDLADHPADDEVTRLTAVGAHSSLQVAADGTAVYALRAAWDAPPQPVRLVPDAVDQAPDALPNPGAIAAVPGRLERIETTTGDGVRLASWLVLPDGASAETPAPLVLWAHGGPVGSWNAWSWRWCPWLLAAQGYAVLLPDPAFSTGYGRDFVARGWGQWGGNPYTDLITAVDAALERPELDAERTAMMGGSYGGYMANWMATHTDRFRAIVTHASLWHVDGFTGATDGAYFWERTWGDPLTRPERYETYSPHRFADAITTPMLVIHGDRDYRVPIGEALRLWYDLQKRSVDAKFLYYPDENHWILTPGNHRVWYETVLAFLGQHVLGEDWKRPALL